MIQNSFSIPRRLIEFQKNLEISSIQQRYITKIKNSMENCVRTILEIRECTISEVTTRNKSTNWKRMDQRVCGATTSNRTRRNRMKFRVTFHPRRVSISLCKYSTVMIDVETDRGRLFRGPYHYILPILILKSGCNGRG